MSVRTRMGLTYLAVIAILTILVAQNPKIDGFSEFMEVEPFLLMSIFFCLTSWVLILRSPVQPRKLVSLKVWRWIHPFDFVMGVASIVTAGYYFAVYLSISERAQVEGWVFDTLRIGSWVAGFVGIPIMLELLYSAIKARLKGQLNQHPVYEQSQEGLSSD